MFLKWKTENKFYVKMALRLATLIVILGSIEARPSIFPMPSVSVIGDISSSPISGVSTDPIPCPVISVSNSSKEGIDIANRINHLFKSIERESGKLLRFEIQPWKHSNNLSATAKFSWCIEFEIEGLRIVTSRVFQVLKVNMISCCVLIIGHTTYHLNQV